MVLRKWRKQKKSKEHLKNAIEHNSEKQNERNEPPDDYHVAVGKMAAFFAHEIRNPLTSIIGFTQFLEQNKTIQSDPTVAHYTTIIREEALRMESLIQELLNLSKSHLHYDNLSIIDVTHCVEKIVTLYQLQSKEKNIHFHSSLIDHAYVYGNTERFERVLINIIKNAVEAVSDNGTIEIQVYKENKAIIVKIIDSGEGIQPEYLEQIFFPFYTTKDGGSGIGLAICKSIIEAMNGTIEIQNHPSKGAQVKLKIPECKHSNYKK
ncbi:HAMP domain-containing histidine kinase [Bacillaceae bacterium Marseille-Q3522]|nr:HAMP domain-containing histidine kinase [Bacillaceae bacterium Marseille-Q3522]